MASLVFPSRRFIPVLAYAALLTLCCGLLPTAAQAKTVFVTPHGGTGYDDQNTPHAETRSFLKGTFGDLRPGDVLKFLSDSPDLRHVARFEGRISLRDLRAAHAPLVIEGLGERTRIVGLSIEELRGCPMPKADMLGCGDELISAVDTAVRIAANLSAGQESDLLETILSEPRIFPVDEVFGAMAGIVPFSVKPNPALRKSDPGRAACINLERVDGLVVRKLHFHNCWLVAVRARESSDITLQDAFIVGGSYGLAVSGDPNGRSASNIKVERVTWIQDASAFGSGDPFNNGCPLERRWIAGCPGDMWRKLPWGTVHHGAYEHLNGALLGGVHLAGEVIFRNNRIINAYNGIRLTARSCSKMPADGKLPRKVCGFNRRLWIYDNDFSYVRDNPVELEDWAEDAYIFHNRFHNAYAALSFDGMGGGPVYVYGNVGWFDDRPTRSWSDTIRGGPCVHNATVDKGQRYKFDPVLDRKFDYDEQVWLPIGYADPEELGDAAEMRCEQSLLGRAIKFSLPDKPDPKEPGKIYNYPLLAPIYVFHNSWYLQAPLTGMGAPANLRHWNNALLFCETGTPGFHDGLCDPEPLPTPKMDECGTYARPDAGLDHFPGETGRIPFFVCFRWDPFDEAGRPVKDIRSEFDWDVSSNGFPVALRKTPGITFEPNGQSEDPGFVAPERGDFRLREGAAAGRTGCAITTTAQGLTCSAAGSTHFVGAFAPDGTRYSGPPGFTPPP